MEQNLDKINENSEYLCSICSKSEYEKKKRYVKKSIMVNLLNSIYGIQESESFQSKL